jgi:type VI secretion system secreted protein VgrG
VAQLWAGKKWGGLFLPRIGQEVIVEFLEGDPDRPIITGRVYNGATMPPYELPGHKTLSTLKSNSSKSGGGFNEIRFEDKKGSEQLFLHAQKDHDLRVGNDCRELVGHNRHLIVRKDQLEQVEGDKHLSVHGDRNEKVDGTISIRAGADVQEKIGGKLGVDSGTEIHLKAGSKVVIEAGAQLTLKGAGGFVEVGPAGVTIEGTMVQINNGASSGSGSGCSPASPEAPDEADSAQPGEVAQRPAPPQPPEPVQYCGQAMVLARAAEDGAPYCARCPTAGRARPDTGAPTEARASAFVGAKGRAEAGVTLRGDPKPPATGDGAAQMMQMQQTDAAAAQTIQTQIAAERQKHEWTKWKILQDTQTKIQEIQPGVSAQKARVHDKMFQKWDKYIRDEE